MALSQRLKADIALGAVSLIWGSTFVLVQNALADASPLVFVFVRFVIASLLLSVLLGRQASLWRPGLPRAGIVAGFFLASGYLFQTVGLLSTTPAKSAFITSLSVVLVPLLLVAAFRRRLRLWTLVGVAAAAAGLYFLTMPPGEFSMARGDLITSFCALAFAVQIVAVGQYAPRYGYAGLTLWQVLAALVFTGVALPVAGLAGWETLHLHWTPRLVVALLVTAVLATALGFTVQSWAQQFTTATHTAILFSLEPVFAALTSYVLVGERLGARGLLGAGLILAGVLLAELRGAAAPDVPGMAAPANQSGGPSI